MFYIIERLTQLSELELDDCFVEFIPFNYNTHPEISEISLVYVRPLFGTKGYIISIEHNEALSIDRKDVEWWLLNNTKRLFVADKKQTMYYFPHPQKLFDINFITPVKKEQTNCTTFYYRKLASHYNVNALIPISKHYEECEKMFETVQDKLRTFVPNPQYDFNNDRTSNVFYQLEKNGIKLSKDKFVEYYAERIPIPEYNILRGFIYTHYNLYTTTSRPSNAFNGINFAALNKENGERDSFIPQNDKFIEIDFQGYHPRIIGELVKFPFPKDRNTYEYLGELLGVSQQDAKELTFKQLYGGIWPEYRNKPFFREVLNYVEDLWDTFQYGGYVSTENRIFYKSQMEDMNPQKLFNYVIQSYETSFNVKILEEILNKLRRKKTKIVLYTYDAFLFDYSKEDKDIINEVITNIPYPVSIKHGTSYHGLEKL